MRIKAKMLLPRKELDAQGNEIDPRQELIDKILEYKKFKEVSLKLADLESIRMQMVKRGNVQKELSQVGEDSGEGTEIQTITVFRLMKAFEKVLQKLQDRQNRPVHTVVQYNYTMEGVREFMLDICHREKTLSFERIFADCENRIHAIFMFLNMLELVQQHYLNLLLGEGRNNFIIEYIGKNEEDVREDVEDADMTENPDISDLSNPDNINYN